MLARSLPRLGFSSCLLVATHPQVGGLLQKPEQKIVRGTVAAAIDWLEENASPTVMECEQNLEELNDTAAPILATVC
jgi:hypothetical protein